jgi:kynurenine formamidase
MFGPIAPVSGSRTTPAWTAFVEKPEFERSGVDILLHYKRSPVAIQYHNALDGWTVVDLSQPLWPGMARWPQTRPMSTTVLATVETDGLYERQMALPEHVGTHVDAPAHFAADGTAVDKLPLRSMVIPGRVIDMRSACRGDPDFALEAHLLEQLEAAEGALTRGCLALFRTGWDRYLAEQELYVGPSSGPPRFPGLAPSAARLLVERGVAGIGIDTLGVEPGVATDYPLHRITLPAGLFHVEGLVGLGQLPASGFLVVVAPLPLVGGSGSPARVLGLLPRT